ncbi:MAG: biosynthetic-type acetolactate synthase large subunit [Cryomorphaceae bacterium]|jgi:acetolactate synthase-1/2/3 large subunit|nr:biosynthetic-type acetolactate synthase large subunit [Cryomorphaceae bacterium]
MNIRGAEAVMRCLTEEGVTTIFGYPGGAIMPVYDALYDFKEQINHILVRHEQGAIHAAQGFARTSGKVGVCLATSGPGATNLITGLADAMIDSTPVVCITGQVASHLLGTDAFQETDVIGISMPVTKYNIQVTRAEDIAPAMAKAFYIAATGRPGPVLVDITKDAQFGMVDFTYEKCQSIRSYIAKPKLDRIAIEDAVALLSTAHKPYLLVGQGVILSEAQGALLNFAEKSGIPVALTLLGLGAFPADHPLYVGYLGMHGNYAPNILTNECDVIVAVGMRFDDRVTGDVSRYAKQAKVIHIDIDPAELNKIVKADVAINADAREALEELTKSISERKYAQWLQQFRDLEQIELNEVVNDAINPPDNELKMAEVVDLLSKKTDGQAIVVTDVGQHQMIASRYYKYKGYRNNITSGGLGTMGFALPAAIGAKLGNPEKTVVAIIGDGGFQMTIQELGTILQAEIDVKILILNNNFLGMVRQWQQLFFDRRYSFTEIVNPNFTAIAKAYSVDASKIEQRLELDEALDQMLNSKVAYLLEVVVQREENVFPMVATGASVSEIRLN